MVLLNHINSAVPPHIVVVSKIFLVLFSALWLFTVEIASTALSACAKGKRQRGASFAKAVGNKVL